MTQDVTVVMMNWARPDNVRLLVRSCYQPHPRVKETIVFDAADYANRASFDLDEPRTVHWSRLLGRDLGLVGRFAAASLAQTDTVLLVDDDIVPGPETLDRLIDHHQTFGGTISAQGRRLDRVVDGRLPLYNTRNVYGVVDVALTRLCCTSRRLCGLAVEPLHRVSQFLKNSQPYGNGEDIVLSYVTRNDGQSVRAIELPYTNLGADDEHSISVRVHEHIQHRTTVCRWCENSDLR